MCWEEAFFILFVEFLSWLRAAASVVRSVTVFLYIEAVLMRRECDTAEGPLRQPPWLHQLRFLSHLKSLSFPI